MIVKNKVLILCIICLFPIFLSQNGQSWDIGVSITYDDFYEEQSSPLQLEYYNRNADLNFEEFSVDYDMKKFSSYGSNSNLTIVDLVDYSNITEEYYNSKGLNIETTTDTRYEFYPCQLFNHSTEIKLSTVISVNSSCIASAYLLGINDSTYIRSISLEQSSGNLYVCKYYDSSYSGTSKYINLTDNGYVYICLTLLNTNNYLFYIRDLITGNEIYDTHAMGTSFPSNDITYYIRHNPKTYYNNFKIYAIDSNTILSYYNPFYEFMYGLKLTDTNFTVNRITEFYSTSNVNYNTFCYDYNGISFNNNITDSYSITQINCSTSSNITGSEKFRYQRVKGYNIIYDSNNGINFLNNTIIDNSDFYFSIVLENLTDYYRFEIEFNPIKLYVDYTDTNITIGSYSSGSYHPDSLSSYESEYVDFNDIIVHFCRDVSDGKIYYYVQQNNRKLISIHWTELDIPYEVDNWDYEFTNICLKNYNEYGNSVGSIIVKGINYWDNFTYYYDIGKLFMNDSIIITDIYEYSDLIEIDMPSLPSGYTIGYALLEYINISIVLDGFNEYESCSIVFDFGNEGWFEKTANDEFNITRGLYIDNFQQNNFNFTLNRTYERYALEDTVVSLDIDFDSLWYFVYDTETPQLFDYILSLVAPLIMLLLLPLILYKYLKIFGGILGFILSIIVLYMSGALTWYQGIIMIICIMAMLVHTYKNKKDRSF